LSCFFRKSPLSPKMTDTATAAQKPWNTPEETKEEEEEEEEEEKQQQPQSTCDRLSDQFREWIHGKLPPHIFPTFNKPYEFSVRSDRRGRPRKFPYAIGFSRYCNASKKTWLSHHLCNRFRTRGTDETSSGKGLWNTGFSWCGQRQQHHHEAVYANLWRWLSAQEELSLRPAARGPLYTR
jgi:hypothetical protein